MSAWLIPAIWLSVLVILPGLVQEWILTILRRHRLDKREGARMHIRRWSPAAARSENYTLTGQKWLRAFKAAQMLQMIGFVVWITRYLL
jgi:hypothetical protein